MTGHTAYGHLRDLGVYGSPNHGVMMIGATQGFNVENVEIKHCGGAGLYVSKCWYASYRNINSWHNKYGLLLNDRENNATDNSVNGIKFDNCWFNNNTLHSVYSDGNTTSVAFNGCTFEMSQTANEAEIKCVNFYSDMSFFNCYMETPRCGFDIKPSYTVGSFNVIGGIYHFRNPTTELANLGALCVFNCIGSFWTVDDHSKMPGACIVSNAVINNTSSRFPNSPRIWDATGNVINNVQLGGIYDDGYQGCNYRTFGTKNLNVIHDSFGKNGCGANLYLGLKRLDRSYSYGIMGTEINITTTGNSSSDLINFVVCRANNGLTDYEKSTFMNVNNYGNVTFSSWVKGRLSTSCGPSSGRPKWSVPHKGALYFDTDLNKLIIMRGNNDWVDCMGASV